MLRDAQYFNTRIGGIDGAGDSGEALVNLVKQKNVAKPAEAASPESKEDAATNGEVSTNTVDRETTEKEDPEKGTDQKAS